MAMDDCNGAKRASVPSIQCRCIPCLHFTCTDASERRPRDDPGMAPIHTGTFRGSLRSCVCTRASQNSRTAGQMGASLIDDLLPARPVLAQLGAVQSQELWAMPCFGGVPHSIALPLSPGSFITQLLQLILQRLSQHRRDQDHAQSSSTGRAPVEVPSRKMTSRASVSRTCSY